MKIRARTVLGIVIVGGLVYIGLQTGKNINKMNKALFRKETLKALDYLPDAALRIKNFHRISVTEGKKEWEIWGNEARFLKDKQQAVLISPRVTLYPKSGEPIRFEGSEGKAYFRNDAVVRMDLTGGITLRHRDMEVALERATYDPETRTISSPSNVTVRGRQIEMTGQRMSLRLPDEKLTIEKDIRVRLYPGHGR